MNAPATLRVDAATGPEGLCAHCHLATGLRPMERRIDGEDHAFCCYGCCLAFQVKRGRGEESEAAWLLIRLGVGGFLSMNIMLLSLLLYAEGFEGADAAVKPWIHVTLMVFATPAMVLLGLPFFTETVQALRRGSLSPSALIVLGVSAAYTASVIAVLSGGEHVYFDTASMVLMLFTVGRYLEAAGRARAARDLEPLLQAESAIALVVEHGREIPTMVRDVRAGMSVRVLPGSRVPVDGVVVEGMSMADEAVVTGESRPIEKSPGAHVIAGSINLDGALLIRATGGGNATRWARICAAVRETLARKSPVQRLADRIVAAAVPLVLLVALAATVYWGSRIAFDDALLAGLAVLVVACPCAVGLAAPIATSLGLARLARHGCLVRDPAALETLAKVRRIAFDKTGTLTEGRPRLVAIVAGGSDEADALAVAAALERHSEHPLAGAIRNAADARRLSVPAAADVRVRPGRGVSGQVDIGGLHVAAAAGTAALMADLGWQVLPDLAQPAATLAAAGHSLVYVGWGEQAHAILAFDDTPLPQAAPTLHELRTRGLTPALLTGDLAPAAARIAAEVGLDEVRAALTPEDKADALVHLRKESGSVVAMVGDGLNDGPVLAAADIGIAVGSATDLARETAGVVLPPDGLWMLPWIVDVARAVRRTVLTNLAWAFGYNLLALAAAAAGLLQPILAAAIMAGSSLLVVTNSLRLERLEDPLPPSL